MVSDKKCSSVELHCLLVKLEDLGTDIQTISLFTALYFYYLHNFIFANHIY